MCYNRIMESTFQSTPSAWREMCFWALSRSVPTKFQSTPSAWRETLSQEIVCKSCVISIHSLRMEGDPGCSPERAGKSNFNPLPPHGGRPVMYNDCYRKSVFQSTPSAWRETLVKLIKFWSENISIHSLRMEGDHRTHAGINTPIAFQSTPSAWRETELHRHKSAVWIQNFNPLPPHGGRLSAATTRISSPAFQSTPSAWRETSKEAKECAQSIEFQSTPSAWRET